jgi:hypothetical protein
MLRGRRALLRRLGGGCLAVAGLAIPGKVRAYFHGECQVVPICPGQPIQVCSGPEVPQLIIRPRFGTTWAGPDADQPWPVTPTDTTAKVGKIDATLQFAGTVYLVQAQMMFTGVPIPSSPPPGQTVGGNSGTNYYWSWKNADGNPLPGVKYSPQLGGGTPNKFVVWWKNSTGGDWQVEAWTFSGYYN